MAKFRDILKTYCTQSTILGLKYFYLYPDKLSRCFWTVNLLAIVGLACFLTSLLWNRFRDMPTRITIEDQYSSVMELPYPAITVCTPNQMYLPNVDHFQKTLVDGNVTETDMKETLKMIMGFYEAVSVVQENLDHLQELIELNRHNIKDVMSSLPQSCDEFLNHCIFETEAVNCMDIFKPILTAHGLCCIFNSPYSISTKRKILQDPDFVPVKPTTPGMYGGLSILANYNPDKAMPGTLFYSGAIKVMINDWTEFPSDDESTLVFPHVESFHTIRGVYTYCSEDAMALDIESRKCVFPDEFELEYFRSFRNSDCDLECFGREIWKSCNCVLFYLPLAKGVNSCNVDSILCILQTRVNLTHQGSEMANCDCARDCDFRKYTSHMTIGNFKAHQFLMTDYLYKDLIPNKTSSLLHLYFENFFYTKQKQETVMSIINLTSNLGGVFGMCLGCSVMSILEIVFFINKVVRNARQEAVKRHRKKRAVGQKK